MKSVTNNHVWYSSTGPSTPTGGAIRMQELRHHLHPQAKRAWVIFSNNHSKIAFFHFRDSVDPRDYFGGIYLQLVMPQECAYPQQQLLALFSTSLWRLQRFSFKKWDIASNHFLYWLLSLQIVSVGGGDSDLWWKCSWKTMESSCVYVFLSRLHCEDQSAHYLCNVRTFWLVFTG